MSQHYGIDVSSNNSHPIAWAAVATHLKQLGAGVQPFAIIKISQGTTYLNPDAAADISAARAAGFAVAGYLMDEGKDSVVSEETVYRQAAVGLPQTDDIELPDGLTQAEYIAHVKALIAEDPTALIYLNQSQVAAGFPTGAGLWLAQYNKQPGVTSHPCVIHQYDDAGTMPGANGGFDMNVWLGSEAEFTSFFNLPHPTPPPVPPTPPPAIPAGSPNAVTTTPNGGTLVAGPDGGVFTFDGATYYGSLPGQKITPHYPIVGIVSTATGLGYWLVGADGGVFSFGDAHYQGGLNQHPEWNAGDGNGTGALGPCIGITRHGVNGYTLICRPVWPTSHLPALYRFGS